MQLLGGGDREAVSEVEAQLVAENRERTGAGAVVLLRTVGKDPFQQVMVLAHGLDPSCGESRLGRRSLPPSRLSANVQNQT